MWVKSDVALLIDIVNRGSVGVVLHNSEIKFRACRFRFSYAAIVPLNCVWFSWLVSELYGIPQNGHIRPKYDLLLTRANE
jgi:hypothetical protein